jgi:hypothetical protein
MKRVAIVCVCLLAAAGAAAQTEPSAASPDEHAGSGTPSSHAAAAAADGQEPQDAHDQHGASDGPSFHLRGFTDMDFAQTDDTHSPDGFSLGQFALHLSASLGPKVSFFGETSFTARSNTFTVEVERAILRYDYNDAFKISVGRYHTPINYWNTAFHHGLWLQTTIDRPQMIEFGGTFLPVHFVGLLAEGSVGPPAAGVGYNFGVGNGRGAILSRAGDAGDVNKNRAWLAKVYARPAALYSVEMGAAVYHDLLTLPTVDGVPELISSAYVAVTRETPEIIAELANVHHHDPLSATDFNSQAFYVQAAWRLANYPDWKPYGRYEKMLGAVGEPVFGDVSSYTGTLGVRYELSDTAALKAEYRHFRRPESVQIINGVFVQAALTF